MSHLRRFVVLAVAVTLLAFTARAGERVRVHVQDLGTACSPDTTRSPIPQLGWTRGSVYQTSWCNADPTTPECPANFETYETSCMQCNPTETGCEFDPPIWRCPGEDGEPSLVALHRFFNPLPRNSYRVWIDHCSSDGCSGFSTTSLDICPDDYLICTEDGCDPPT